MTRPRVPSVPPAVLAALLTLPPGALAQEAVPPPGVAMICLAPASVEMASGDADQGLQAVRETFTSFLTGPTLAVTPLTSRLASQVREEARRAECPYLLLTTLKHSRKSGGGGLLGRVAAGAVRDGAWSAAAGAGSRAGRVAASAAAGAASEAAWNVATGVRNRDEMELTYRLEGVGGEVLVEKTLEREAESDGEDLLTPLVGEASEAVAEIVTARTPPAGGAEERSR